MYTHYIKREGGVLTTNEGDLDLNKALDANEAHKVLQVIEEFESHVEYLERVIYSLVEESEIINNKLRRR